MGLRRRGRGAHRRVRPRRGPGERRVPPPQLQLAGDQPPVVIRLPAGLRARDGDRHRVAGGGAPGWWCAAGEHGRGHRRRREAARCIPSRRNARDQLAQTAGACKWRTSKRDAHSARTPRQGLGGVTATMGASDTDVQSPRRTPAAAVDTGDVLVGPRRGATMATLGQMALSFGILLAVWWLLSAGIASNVLPHPPRAFQAIGTLTASGELPSALWTTVPGLLIGLVADTFVGA